MKLSLQYSEVLNGQFSPGEINLMMVFQVNCPGCFIHGFPLLNQLQAQYQGGLSCFAMSTAFEDFELNTMENTQLLIDKGEFVGETLKAHQAGLLNWSKVSFPVLVDQQVEQNDLVNPLFIDSIIQNEREWQLATQPEKQKVRTALQEYFVQLRECGYTFATNLMQGTPTFILFNKSMDILLQWFGHTDPKLAAEKIATFIKKNNEQVSF